MPAYKRPVQVAGASKKKLFVSDVSDFLDESPIATGPILTCQTPSFNEVHGPEPNRKSLLPNSSSVVRKRAGKLLLTCLFILKRSRLAENVLRPVTHHPFFE